MTRIFAATLLLALGGGLTAFGQGASDLPPQIDDVRYFLSRGVEVEREFDPDTEVIWEGDVVRIQIDVSIVVEDDVDPVEEDDQEIEFFYEKRSSWLPFGSYLTPAPPPIPEDTKYLEFLPLPLERLGVRSYRLQIEYEIPDILGVSQARLRGLTDYDVRYVVRIRIWDAETPAEEDPVPFFFFLMAIVEDPNQRPPNPPPFADAGADQTVQMGSTVQLDGIRSFDSYNLGFDVLDPDVFDKDDLTYVWEFVEGPQRVDPTYPDPVNQPWLAEVDLNVVGDYVYRLFVFDGVEPLPNDDSVDIHVVAFDPNPENQSPWAIISGPTAAVVVGDIITLDGSGSSDPDDLDCENCNYRWRQTDELGGSIPPEEFGMSFQPLGGLEEVTSSWQALGAGTYYFMLIVDDGELSAAARTSVTVIDSETAGFTAEHEDEAAEEKAFDLAPALPISGCGAGLLPVALLPLVFWLMRGRVR